MSALGTVLFLYPLQPSASGFHQFDWFMLVILYTLLLQLQRLWRWRILLGYRFERAAPEIQERARILARRLKTKPPRVLLAKSSQDSRLGAAYFVALAGLVDRIVLSDRITQDLSSEEMDAVLAHEIGHKRLAPLQLLALYCLTILPIAFVARLVLPPVAAAFNLSTGVEVLPLFLLFYETYLLAMLPLTSAVSRLFEQRADRFAVRATGNPAAFARAMVKLYDRNLIFAVPGPVWKHLFATHPSGIERVEHALSVADKMSGDPHRKGDSSNANRV